MIDTFIRELAIAAGMHEYPEGCWTSGNTTNLYPECVYQEQLSSFAYAVAESCIALEKDDKFNRKYGEKSPFAYELIQTIKAKWGIK